MAFIKPKPKPAAAPAQVPVTPPAPVPVAPPAPESRPEFHDVRRVFDRLTIGEKAEIIVPYMVTEMHSIIASELSPNDRYELAKKLLDWMKLADVANLVCPAFVDASKSEKAAAERIAEEYASYRNEDKVEQEHEDWFSELDIGKIVEAADRDRETPMTAEATAEKLNGMAYVFRDQWFSQFIANLSPASCEDLGAYWHG